MTSPESQKQWAAAEKSAGNLVGKSERGDEIGIDQKSIGSCEMV